MKVKKPRGWNGDTAVWSKRHLYFRPSTQPSSRRPSRMGWV